MSSSDKGHVFLIGCGPSLTAITQAEWASIARQDTAVCNSAAFDIDTLSEGALRPTYAFMVDSVYFRKAELAAKLGSFSRLVTMDHSWVPDLPNVHKVRSLDCDPRLMADGDGAHYYAGAGWSWDMAAGAYLYNNVAFFALQYLVWRGYRTIYLLGIDGTSGYGSQTHYWGTSKYKVGEKYRQQREAWGYAAGRLAESNANRFGIGIETGRVRVYNLSPISRVTAFPRLRLAAALSRLEAADGQR